MATTTAPQPQPSQALIQLLTAAVVSPRFRARLLTNPRAALAEGYAGTFFPLTQEEEDRVVTIRAASLEAFAAQLESLSPGLSYPTPPAPQETCSANNAECQLEIPAPILLMNARKR